MCFKHGIATLAFQCCKPLNINTLVRNDSSGGRTFLFDLCYLSLQTTNHQPLVANEGDSILLLFFVLRQTKPHIPILFAAQPKPWINHLYLFIRQIVQLVNQFINLSFQ